MSLAKTRRSRGGCHAALHLLGDLEHLVVQDMFLTATAELAHVVLPAAASWCEIEGTVTIAIVASSECAKPQSTGSGAGRPGHSLRPCASTGS